MELIRKSIQVLGRDLRQTVASLSEAKFNPVCSRKALLLPYYYIILQYGSEEMQALELALPRLERQLVRDRCI